MNYEDFEQLSIAIKSLEGTVNHAMEMVTSANTTPKEADSLLKALKHLTKMKHILDRQLHIEHAPPAPWDSHDLFF